MALGASGGDVLRMVLREGMRLIGSGLLIGIAGALLASRLVGSLLYEVSATDPATFVGAAAVLGAAGLLASYLPARRATRVDPMITLRYE